VDNWQKLVQFMGQWFHACFFELPGHGKSSPFRERFSSRMVAELVEQLADALGCQRFNLMGFSFGGILAMRAFTRLSSRIDRLMLIAPCLDRRTLLYSSRRLDLLQRINRFLDNPKTQKRFYDLLHHPVALPLVAKFLQVFGHVEKTIPLKEKLPTVRPTTLAVLNAQIQEILTAEFEVGPQKYDTPCYFAMSIHDPLLSFDLTLEILQAHFANLNTVRLTYPFHQLPGSFTYYDLDRDFHATVDAFMSTKS
jgi:alpha/beta hydrolase fold